MNKFWPLALALALFSFFITSCDRSSNPKLQEWMSDNGKLKVLCTTAMIANLVQEVGMDEIDCLTLIQGESDPHSYQLVKGDDEKLSRADLIFYNGLGLEHGPSLSERLRNNPKAHSIGDFLSSVAPQDIIVYNGSVDPHVWMDVSLWEKSVPLLYKQLSIALPASDGIFKTRRDLLSNKLNQLHQKIYTAFQHIPEQDRYLVTSHEACNYFVRAYLATDEERKNATWNVRAMAPEGLAPESQLSTADIQKLVEYIIKYKVKTLFSESNVSRDSLKKLAEVCSKYGYVVHIAKDALYIDAMGPAGSTYADMMSYDADVIEKGLADARSAQGI